MYQTKIFQVILFIIFENFSKFLVQFHFIPIKREFEICYENFIYELLHDLLIRILGNKEILEKIALD